MAKTKRKPTDPYDPWEDKPDRGRSRPTLERIRKGQYRLVTGDDAGVTVAIDETSDPLRDCYFKGKIPAGLLYAGERFEGLCRSQVKHGPRSCLDWMPRGAGEPESDYQARRHEMWRDLCRVMGMETSFILMDVCFHHNGTGPRRPDARRWVRLLDGLETCRKFWGIPLEEKERDDE